MEMLGVWATATWDERIKTTGKNPVSTRRVDVNTGRDGGLDARSRLAARDFKVRGYGRKFDVFASMPPLETKRLLSRTAAVSDSLGGDGKRGPAKPMFLDVKKAHLSGKSSDDEYACVEFPEEAGGGVG